MEPYSITTNFGGVSPNLLQLHNEIVDNINILKYLKGVVPFEDSVNIIFDLSLSAPEKTELDGIISSHVPIYIPELSERMTIRSKISSTKKKSYIRLGTEIFLGSTYATAKTISYMDSNVTSYDIQIFDKDNHEILLTKTLTNTTESVQELGILSNVSTIPTQIEISVKKNGAGGGKVYVESVTICYA